MKTKNNKTALIGTLVMVALSLPMASLAADKLIVKDVAGTTNMFTVGDTGQVYSAGKLGVGTTNPGGPLEVVAQWPSPAPTNIHSVFTSYGDPSRLTVRSAQGTLATPLNSKANNMLGNVNFRGFDGTNFSTSGVAAIQGYAETDFTPTSQPTRIAFFTAPVNAIVGAERFRIASDGRLRLSNQPAAPANTDSCTTGDLVLDAANGFLYLCTATNSWKRTAFVAY